MKIVGVCAAVVATVGLAGCAGVTDAAQHGAGAAPAAVNATTDSKNAGREAAPAAQPAAGQNARVKNGVTIHPEAPGAPSARLPALGGARAAAAQRAALVRAPLPRQATAKGRLAAGHPALLAGLPGSTVTVSSVSPSGSELQVGLTATTTSSTAQVLAGYRAKLAALGFVEATVHGVSGASASRFTRGKDVITISAKTTGKRTAYTVFGLLHTTG